MWHCYSNKDVGKQWEHIVGRTMVLDRPIYMITLRSHRHFVISYIMQMFMYTQVLRP